MIMISSNFIFSFTNFCVIVSFFVTKLPTIGVLYSTTVRAVVLATLVRLGISPLISFVLALRGALVAKLVILGISPLNSFILPLREALVAKLVISGILSSIVLIVTLYRSFLTTSFLLHQLLYLNQQEQVLIHQHLIYLLYFLNCSN